MRDLEARIADATGSERSRLVVEQAELRGGDAGGEDQRGRRRVRRRSTTSTGPSRSGSVDAVIPAARLRPEIIGAIERSLGGELSSRRRRQEPSMLVAETPSTSGSASRSASRSSGHRPGHVDRRDRGAAAPEDPVLHVLDVETGPAQPVQDVGEDAHPVQVPHGEGRGADPARASG